MKLGNKGWGIRSMIFYTAIIVLFLLIAIYLIYNLYGNFKKEVIDSPNKNKKITYSEMETDLTRAGIKYVEEYYTRELGIDTITVTVENLVSNGLVNQPKDEKKGTDCSGYVLVAQDENGIVNGNAYLKCSNYTTNGYQAWRIE